MTGTERQPSSGPSLMPNTSDVAPNVPSTAPRTSSASRSPTVSFSAKTARTTISSPIGTLMRKIQRHDTSVSAPPTMSPVIDPMPVIAA